MPEHRTCDVLVVGAGFAGMYLLHRLRAAGLDTLVVDRAGDVGGTWYWNRYPGARCDVESVQYSYQFSGELQQHWRWRERYAPQPEILAYACHVAERYDLKRDIRFNEEVVAAHWNEPRAVWQVTTDRTRYEVRFLIMATGCLSVPNWPRIEGLSSFAGPVYHTAQWPHEPVDFTGRRVAVIGTGSSAIQSIPQIARQASRLSVFQRTANYSIPAQNCLLDETTSAAVMADYAQLRRRAWAHLRGIAGRPPIGKLSESSPATIDEEYERRWREGGLLFLDAFRDVMDAPELNEIAAEFVRNKIRAMVRDPVTAKKLCPTNIIGGKRLCVDIGYFETYNRDNVELVDVRDNPVESIEPNGVRAHGRLYEVDDLVLATGFDAMTGALLAVDIRGREGITLRDEWRHGPSTYLGMSMAGFPNLFTVTGPESPSVLTNMLPSIEQHVVWITECLSWLSERGIDRIEATAEAQTEWHEHSQAVANAALKSTTPSWYLGSNVEGKPRTFMPYLGGLPDYVAKCEKVAAKGYTGFALARVQA